MDSADERRIREIVRDEVKKMIYQGTFPKDYSMGYTAPPIQKDSSEEE